MPGVFDRSEDCDVCHDLAPYVKEARLRLIHADLDFQAARRVYWDLLTRQAAGYLDKLGINPLLGREDRDIMVEWSTGRERMKMEDFYNELDREPVFALRGYSQKGRPLKQVEFLRVSSHRCILGLWKGKDG